LQERGRQEPLVPKQGNASAFGSIKVWGRVDVKRGIKRGADVRTEKLVFGEILIDRAQCCTIEQFSLLGGTLRVVLGGGTIN